MHMVVAGINYRTAPVEIREKFTFSEQDLPAALQQLKQQNSILECVIVATCNRTEIYAVVDRLHLHIHYIRDFIENWFQISRDEFNPYLYIHEDDKAMEHLFRVTTGLDSMIIGETQILGQVRDAFLTAQSEKATGTLFNQLFKQAVTLAKRAHNETSIGENPVSVSYAAVELGKRIFGQYTGKTILILGAGKMSELTAKHLHDHGANQVIVANRTLQKAEQLAGKFAGTASDFEQITKVLSQADIVISSTGSSEYVLTKEQVQLVMKKRKSRPLFMVDIAVPRDLDPEISELSNVYLYDIDDLHSIVETNLQERAKEAERIYDWIQLEMEQFDLWFKTLGVSPVIRALQEKAAKIHEDTIESLFQKLTDLDEREKKLIRKLSKSMLNQMVRDPIQRVKEKAGQRNGEEALEMFTQLFALEEMLDEEKDRTKAELSKHQEELDERRVKKPGLAPVNL